MVIYEVNVRVTDAIYTAYHAWLLLHVKQMLRFPGFLKADMGVVDDQLEKGSKQFRISYSIASAHHLENYLQLHASQMRAAAVEAFGDQFSVSRRIMWEAAEVNL